jgi:hypothetical protein
MADTLSARPRWRRAMPPNRCAMIFRILGDRAEFGIFICAAKRCTPMIAFDRSKLSCHAILFLVLIGLPCAARSATLEDAAKEFARRIATALPAGENVSCEVRNLSSLRSEQAAGIEQALQGELQVRGFSLTGGAGTISIVITLSENFKNLVWTAEIHGRDAAQVIVAAVERLPEQRTFSIPMPVTIRSEKFWDGPEHILDVMEVAGIDEQRWFVLLLPDRLEIQEPMGRMEINFPPAAIRDPVGRLDAGQGTNTIVFSLPSRICTADLGMRRLIACQPDNGAGAAGSTGSTGTPILTDLAPAGPPSPGKGIELAIESVCGGASQFLATGGGDYTQTDSLQVLQSQSGGAASVSAELDFPGPITALHVGLDTPRAVVRNLRTGNYEAYRLSLSCNQ